MPSNCGFAYFCESNSITSLYGERTIGKYQKIELIYKELLSIFSESSSYNLENTNSTDEKCNIIMFSSAAGGVGCSTLAVASAIHLAKRQKQVLYLNLELFGGAENYLTTQASQSGQSNFDNVIYALKSKRANIPLKIESNTLVSDENVNYFNSSKLSLSIDELTCEDIESLLTEISLMNKYDYVIVDKGLDFNKKTWSILEKANKIVLISDGSLISNFKTERALQSLNVLEKKNNAQISQKILIAYNKFSSKNGCSSVIEFVEMTVVHWYSSIILISNAEILNSISNMDIFNNLIS